MQTTKDVVKTVDERVKWKTKAGVFETKESASTNSMKLPQFAEHREFEVDKLHLNEDPYEKRDVVIGRDVCQKTGLDMLNSTQQFQ